MVNGLSITLLRRLLTLLRLAALRIVVLQICGLSVLPAVVLYGIGPEQILKMRRHRLALIAGGPGLVLLIYRLIILPVRRLVLPVCRLIAPLISRLLGRRVIP